ncbi:Glu/Leu/Phe/Val dehydrogenase dimerization domain-containing protein [Brevibacterium casei]|uniref:Glutamate dehydrogenase n=2 Tax=Brevibacterium casei TaxID=33889 RepID=A0A2H1K830_9MICO|nr:Glu/Leu/Phe/Val dehydrogenase dimerization domain-containing protein [Brevibacterium casei]SIG97122.1 glutamate dehydrogenase [Mycobacteroides abscessus subsp. abscessus]MBE4695332.1 glutamate dehydrogenase [Brevibacterium casei]MBY3578454.1 glutamate dehydrogenase [Brevibacterium casei]MCT2181677.1 glutamate dehydrogenase [Brevibacterium casei]MDH5148951.1 Glu/Leu/Phe/Val dehydrogenase dimerization domain-containing protein [Brevibacterium casei]
MFLDITWQDPVTGTHGFVVIDTLVRGSASGGLRMREGCTLEEVRGLAEGMTRKEAIHLVPGRRYVPLGGAKGGIDFDPRAEGATDVLERFLVAVNPIMRAYWALGEDLGVRQDDIDEILERRALGSGLAAVEKLMDDPEDSARRSLAAFDTVVDGMPQDELVGGLGVATAALTALAADGRSPEGATAVIQGFGSMGGATARFLAEAGVRVVGIADADGFVSNPEGLDVETLLATRDPFGGVSRDALRPGDQVGDRDDWLAADADILIPAAVSYAITPENAGRITAKYIVEAANMPVLPEAEELLAARGVVVVPDFLANSATNAWWWWVAFGDIDGSWEQSREIITDTLGALTSEALSTAKDEGISPRAAAQRKVDANLVELEAVTASAGGR